MPVLRQGTLRHRSQRQIHSRLLTSSVSDPMAHGRLPDARDGCVGGEYEGEGGLMDHKLTEREALEKTRDMWEWIEKHPRLGKRDYLASVGVPFASVAHDCYCCEYVIQQTDVGSQRRRGMLCEEGNRFLACCPLRHMWPTSCEGHAPESPFKVWWRESEKDQHEQEVGLIQECAREIADACTEALDALSPEHQLLPASENNLNQ
jgi:hypothetical protein